jgi:hypothetical protein
MPASHGTTTVTRRPTAAAKFMEQTRLQSEGSESSSSVEWSCTAEGLRAATAPNMIVMLVGTEGLGPWTDTGVDVPPAAAWHVGSKWRRIAEASGRGAKASVRKVVASTAYEIVARERVTVPAGSYEAFKVESTVTIDADGDKQHGRLLTTATTAWYVQDVGIVESRSLSTLRSSGTGAPESGTGGIRMQRTIALKDFTGNAPR